jgi:hypothetical protein
MVEQARGSDQLEPGAIDELLFVLVELELLARLARAGR